MNLLMKSPKNFNKKNTTDIVLENESIKLQLQSKKDNLFLLKQNQQIELDSILTMETQLKQLEEDTHSQCESNRIVKRNRFFLIAIVLIILIFSNILYKIYLTNNNSSKIAEYTTIINEKELEYQNFIDANIE